MKKNLLLTLFSLNWIITFAQTELMGKAIIPISLVKTTIPYSGNLKPIIKLKSLLRLIDILSVNYEISGKNYIVTKQVGKIIAYQYDFNFQTQATIDSVTAVQINDKNSLPELIIYISNIWGSSMYDKTRKDIAIVDFDLNKVLFDMPVSSTFSSGNEPTVELQQEIRVVKEKVIVGEIKSENYSSAADGIRQKPLPKGEYIFQDGQLSIKSKF